jgi:hypothetical protein
MMRTVIKKKMRGSIAFFQRLDRVAADLNVVLVVLAVGLATLDFTFLVTQKVIDRLPQVTRVADDAQPPAVSPALVQPQK